MSVIVGTIRIPIVGDPTDRLLADRGAVYLSEVRADLPGREALGIQRQHDLIDTVKPSLPLAHDLRLERPGPVTRHLDLDLPGRLGQHRLRTRAVADVARPSTSRDPSMFVKSLVVRVRR